MTTKTKEERGMTGALFANLHIHNGDSGWISAGGSMQGRESCNLWLRIYTLYIIMSQCGPFSVKWKSLGSGKKLRLWIILGLA
jgi:hypothetical protein